MHNVPTPPTHQMQMEAGKQEKKQPKKAIFVHSTLDQAGLDVYEFRLLAHIARRGSCFASLTTTARICKMSVRKAQSSLKSLEEKGFIQKKSRKGRTGVYNLAPDIWDRLQALPPMIPPPTPTADELDDWDF